MKQEIPEVENRGAKTVRDFLLRAEQKWRTWNGAAEYPLTIALFLRVLGIVYFIAFVSLATQVLGLYGSQGILPIADWMAQQAFGLENVWALPTLFWLNTSDGFLQAAPITGALFSVALVLLAARANWVRRAILIALFVLYLSLVAAGQDFMAYQWDALLVEVGFIAIFLGDANIIIWLYRWLLFRLMLLSGLVKIFSGDPAWRNWSALDYHFETQPLPNVIGFYVHHLPSGVHQFMVAAMLFIELVAPFLIFAPRRIRFVAGALIALLQVQIFLTGNFNFFNLLTLALCILLLDDRAIEIAATKTPSLPAQTGKVKNVLLRVRGVRAIESVATKAPSLPPQTGKVKSWIASAVALFLFVVSALQLLALFRVPLPGIVEVVSDAIAPLRIVNFYGPFAVMTTTRPEIVIEGSDDGEHWRAYEFKYKPGDVRRAPPFVAPHQPRLDWQMWFAALHVPTGDARALLPPLRSNATVLYYMQNYGVDAWFVNFLARLLQGSPHVLALLESNPFPDAPPRFVRARFYNYRFAEADAPCTRGEWWARQERGLYFPALSGD